MGALYKGTIYIPGEDFWTWVEKNHLPGELKATMELSDKKGAFFEDPFFSETFQELLIKSGLKHMTIPGEDFWTWIIDNFCPAYSNHHEVIYGTPTFNKESQEFEIAFSASSDGDPDPIS